MADFKVTPTVNGVSVSLSGHAHNLADVTGLQTALGKKLDTTANAASATKLNTARTLTIGITGKTFDGSANVSWTLADIGAASTSHNHTLDSLSNTTITSIASGDILKWNGTAWINNTLAEAGIQPAGSYLTANQTITVSGDATGSGTTAITLTLANSGVTAGTYGKVTVDAKGRVTVGASLAATDIPVLDASKITTGTMATARLPSASTSAAGIVQLSSATNSTSTTLAATASAVKVAYDLANAAIPSSQKGVVNGVASLDSSGLVPANQLPSYVDDVLEYANLAALPATGETGKIYVTADNNKIFRWSGTTYIEISPTAGNADSTTKLATARTINGTNFDGTANITTANWGTGRTLTIGSAGKTVNGSANVSWTVAEIGAAAASHTHVSADITDATNANTANTIVKRDASGNFSAGTITANLTGNATTATTLATGRTIGMTGDVTWTSTSFNGSGNVTGTATLANSGVTAGTYNDNATHNMPITVDAKGRITGTGTAVTIKPAWSSITSKPTTLDGYGITDAVKKYAGNIGNGTLTTIPVTHNLNTLDVTVAVRLAASPYDFVYPDINVVDANSVSLVFESAPATNQFRVIVTG